MKIVRWLNEHAEEAVLLVLLLIITLSTGLQVVMRYILNHSLTWTEEISKYSLICSGFFSIGYCLRKNASLRIDLVVSLLPPLVRKIIAIATHIFLALLFLYLLQGAVAIRAKMHEINAHTPALEIPLIYIYTMPVIGFILAIVRSIQAMVAEIRTPAQAPSATPRDA